MNPPKFDRHTSGPNILLVTVGSYGDLHPFLEMGRALKRTGARATVATHEAFRDQVEAAGLAFAPVPPGPDDLPIDAELAARANAPISGIKVILDTVTWPFFERFERRIEEILPGHDLMIAHFLALAAPAVAESRGIPWLSTALAPTTFFSAHDPPALAVLPFLPRLRGLGPEANRPLYRILEWPSRNWFKLLHEQRRRRGLPPLATNPLFQNFSPSGTLALFTPTFAAPQPDWPPRTTQLGFPLFAAPHVELSPATRTFLDAGPPPLVFTLGTAISLMRTNFFDVARRATRRLGRRAIFVIGPNPPPELAELRSTGEILITRFEPYPKLIPRAAVFVHHGGVNTTALSLSLAQAQVVVPFAHDQLDNARRVERLGAGRALPASRLSARRLALAIQAAAALRSPRPPDEPIDFDRALRGAVDRALGESRALETRVPVP